MDEKGQGALEYLLLIAGAILVVAVVLYVLGGILTPTKHTIHGAVHNIQQHFTTGS